MTELLAKITANAVQREGIFFTSKVNNINYLVIRGNDPDFESLGNSGNMTVCAQNTYNAHVLRSKISFVNPSSRKGHAYSLGLGDRLGLASTGHIKTVRGKGVFPVLAQQSIRELNLTGRTYSDVLASAVWAVFNENYREGFGADGDHLKQPFEIEYALNSGYSMITLDCSEHIDNTVLARSDEELYSAYATVPADARAAYEDRYLKGDFSEFGVHFTKRNLAQSVLIYSEAIDYASLIYNRFIAPGKLDFEVSIDETATPTTPENHFFIASEFARLGIVCETVAPRFCGEFQKGINYIGDLKQFENEYKSHEAIAQKFGYRISVHSGSDKFDVFPIIAKHTKGVHVKTAGTNWLEALRVLAKCEPDFLRELYTFAVENLDTAKAYYHIRPTKASAPSIDAMPDKDLPSLLDNDDTRQILHITYGLILSARSEGKYVYKTKLYDALNKHSAEYDNALIKHIGKHMSLLFNV